MGEKKKKKSSSQVEKRAGTRYKNELEREVQGGGSAGGLAIYIYYKKRRGAFTATNNSLHNYHGSIMPRQESETQPGV